MSYHHHINLNSIRKEFLKYKRSINIPIFINRAINASFSIADLNKADIDITIPAINTKGDIAIVSSISLSTQIAELIVLLISERIANKQKITTG